MRWLRWMAYETDAIAYIQQGEDDTVSLSEPDSGSYNKSVWKDMLKVGMDEVRQRERIV